MIKGKYADGHFNQTFYKLRESHNVSLRKLSQLTSFSRQLVMKVESGYSTGSIQFWREIQELFDVSDEDMWKLINGKEIDDETV